MASTTITGIPDGLWRFFKDSVPVSIGINEGFRRTLLFLMQPDVADNFRKFIREPQKYVRKGKGGVNFENRSVKK